MARLRCLSRTVTSALLQRPLRNRFMTEEHSLTDPFDTFDIENPKLPKSIREAALASGGYPYDDKLSWDTYGRQAKALQEQLVLLQDHMLKSGERTILVFEGRDAAGKGGAIATYLEY